MTREEALKSFEEENKDFEKIFERYGYQMSPEEVSAVKEAIERNKVAISALTEELSEDGTLTVHVKDGSKVKRVFVMGDNIFGGLYYPDSAENKPEHEKLMNDIEENREKEVVIVQTENKGDLISRQAVINAIANTCFWLSADNWEELTKCISSIPSVENKCFEGMTNGEVMKAVFPNCYMGIDDDEWIVTNIDGRTMFQPEWWNAPYKAESEE